MIQNSSVTKIFCVSSSEMELWGLTIFMAFLTGAWKTPWTSPLQQVGPVCFMFRLLIGKRLKSKWDSDDKNNFLSYKSAVHSQINIQLTFTPWSHSPVWLPSSYFLFFPFDKSILFLLQIFPTSYRNKVLLRVKWQSHNF